jgi:hypothetical protein
MNNDLGKIYEDRIPVIKPKNIIKEQEVICEDITAYLNSVRDNKNIRNSNQFDYNSNSGSNALDDKGKKKLELLSGIRKQDYNSAINSNTVLVNNNNNYNTTINTDFELNDNKAKNDFQKFMINKNETTSSAKLQSLKTDSNNKNLKVQILFFFSFILLI